MEEHRPPREAQQQQQQLRKKTKAKKRASKYDNAHDSRHDEERRLKKLRKQAQRVVEHFAALGLDEFGQPLDNFSLLKYPVRECKFSLPGVNDKPIAINPVVAMIGGLLPWVCVLLSVRK